MCSLKYAQNIHLGADTPATGGVGEGDREGGAWIEEQMLLHALCIF